MATTKRRAVKWVKSVAEYGTIKHIRYAARIGDTGVVVTGQDVPLPWGSKAARGRRYEVWITRDGKRPVALFSGSNVRQFKTAAAAKAAAVTAARR